MLQTIRPGAPWLLHNIAATRRLEQTAAAALPAHALMQRAGLAVARLAFALAPHTQIIWIACGPGNNGGDGLEAAMHLKRWGKTPVVTWLGDLDHAPGDARQSALRAQNAGVLFAAEPPATLTADDLCIDALLGIGATRPPTGVMAECCRRLSGSAATQLAVDVPTGLNANTGTMTWPTPGHATTRHTLSLLTLKPGLFTADGRDACGRVWFDDLDVTGEAAAPIACLNAAPMPTPRPHASHKGNFGDVAIVGGETQTDHAMLGAALLAASAALHAGAGRVYVAPLGVAQPLIDFSQPELMFRAPARLAWDKLTVVAGCGGGSAIARWLPAMVDQAQHLVFDADALNAIANNPTLTAAIHQRGSNGMATVFTPHPLEAARLLQTSTAHVQQDRLAAAHALATQLNGTIVLKGSGTIIAAPGQTPRVNPTGNGRLASAGTGDVLAGIIGAHLAAGLTPFDAACRAVWQHGLAADQWPSNRALTASSLAARMDE